MKNKIKNKKKPAFQLVLGFVVLALVAVSGAYGQPPPPRLLTLNPPTGLPVIPIMEGWYANDDGSVTISFGYVNRNTDEVVNIPIGPNNHIEPAEFNGMQPTHFDTNRHVGAFTITVPADRKDEDIWWHIKTGNHPVMKVPGRADSTAYELDRRPRPQGTIEPTAWLVEGGEQGAGPTGIVGDFQGTAKVGVPVEMAVHTKDNSVRDPEDPRFKEPLSLRLTWFKHQGPGSVAFTRHEAHPLPAVAADGEEAAARTARPTPEVVTLPQPEGTARIYATFSDPGEYIVRARIDNWNSPDSSAGNQCCWTNVYQRVTVTP
jgi:hypothetical protein